MNAWWQALAERERRMLLAALAVVLVGVFYAGVWAPLQRGVAARSERVAVLRSDLLWMRGAAVRLLALRAQAALRPAAGAPAAGASTATTLAASVTASARAQGLYAVLEVRAGGDRSATLQLNLKPLPFASLLPWLAALQAQGIHISALHLQAAGAGQVQGSVSLQRQDSTGADSASAG
ncbi:type II secretion system protein GspM [Metallibacterium scheffleri]|uniref:type II secretion system protein GspM n=1 Tax=Metallibacterium scheffleri TaxID=993689 RepID=UPI0023F4EEE8|nr:type II secretion system protein GspM [Metallibacterium scheffleri]